MCQVVFTYLLTYQLESLFTYLLTYLLTYLHGCQAHSGEFYGCLSSGVVPSLVDAGFVFVVRWALDDAVDNSLASAVDALHAMIVCAQDEVRTAAVTNLLKLVLSDFIHILCLIT